MGWLSKIFKKKTYLREYTNSPQFVISMLKKLQTRRSSCMIHFSGDQAQYVTMILDINQTKKQFTIDEIVPREGQNKSRIGESLRITASDNGIAIIFKAVIVATETQGNSLCSILEIPQYIEYKQRRAAFRVPVTVDNNVIINLQLHDKEIANTNVQDISFTGMAFVIKDSDFRNEILVNSILDKIYIITPQQETIYLRLEIKRVRYIERDNATLVAGQFIGFTHQQQRRIDLFVSQLERANMLKKTEDNQ